MAVMKIWIRVQVPHIKHMNSFVFYTFALCYRKKKNPMLTLTSQTWLNQHHQEKQGMFSIHMPVSTLTPYMQISPAMLHDQ